MKYTFYIGALEIDVHTEEELVLQQYDARFQQQVIPSERHIMVRLTICDQLEIPEGKAIQVRGMKIWHQAGWQIRLYDGYEIKDEVLSQYDGRDTVFVNVTRNVWQKEKQFFQPWFFMHIEDLLLSNHALLLHSASIVYRSRAILFTAPSGTGKTTQTDLWHRWREGVSDLNGDRTVLQKTKDGWLACGFPVYGGSNRCEQAAVPVEAIVIIRQAERDEIRELSIVEKIGLLYSEITVMSAVKENVEMVMNLVMELAVQVRILQLNCTMNESAVNVLHLYLYGE